MIPTPILLVIAATVYLSIGLATFAVAERHHFEGENWRLIYSWPVALFVAALVLSLVLPVIHDTLGDEW